MTTPGQIGTPAGEDRAQLVDFLREVQEFLPDTLNDHPDWFPAELLEPLSAAWDELQPSFEMAVGYLSDPPDPDLLDTQLAHVGLRGKQLALKLGGVGQSLGRLRSEGTKRALRSLLGWANIILGSLGGLVPGGEAIQEYKEAYEQASKDAKDEDGPAEPPKSGDFQI
jgi:hypothetical protein